jgi:hypothetical protein
MKSPVSYNLTIYEGATFTLNFRLKEDGSVVDLTGYSFSFVASEKPEQHSKVFDTADSPTKAFITIDEDDDWLVTLTIPAIYTDDITAGELYYNIDATLPDGTIERKLHGSIEIVRAA